MQCQCGKRLSRRTVKYYINEFNEYIPICKDCALLVKDYLEILK